MKWSSIFASIFMVLTLGSRSHAQTPVLSNPSMCYDLGEIRDFTCPSNSGFYQPNRFLIRVLEAPGAQLGVDVYLKEVRLIIEHTWAADLEISLVSPSGKKVELTSDNGGGENNYGNPIFQDCSEYAIFAIASCTPVQQGRPPFTGISYLPEESLLNFNDGSNPVGDWTLLICDDTEQDSGRLHFVELVFDRIQCLPVQTVQILSQDTTSLVLDWTPSGGCGGIRTFLEYGPRGFVPGQDSLPGVQGTLLELHCPPFLLTGLAPDSEYDLYIRKSCSPEAYSGNSCPVAVRTGCLPPEPVVIEDFASSALCAPICGIACTLTGIWQNAPEGDFDWLVYTGATPTPGTGPSSGVDGVGKYVYIETSGNQCAGRAILRSGCFLLNKQNSDACHLSFYYHMYGANTGSLALEASKDGIRWDRLWQLQGDQGDQWRKVYISLAPYPDGSLMQFRFVGTKGNGQLGDIALAQISIHGSQYLGMPEFRFYVDQDGDGYGNPNISILSCAAEPPQGYVAQTGDCNDQNPAIHPGTPEVPCDRIDNNCNGMGDDVLLPPPVVVNDTICSGELATLSAIPLIGSFIFWYDAPNARNGISASRILVPTLPPNTTTAPQVYRFYAEAVDEQFRCFSGVRAEAIVVVNPLPKGELAAEAAFCPGDSLELAALPIRDLNFTGASVRFHRGLPVRPDNALASTKILPANRQVIAYHLISPEGCTFSDTFSIRERSLPEIRFLPADSFSLCTGSSRQVEAIAESGAGGYQFLWETGETSAIKTVTGGLIAGQRRFASVRVTDAAGCSSTDSLLFFTTSSIDSLFREIEDASVCGLADGKIILRPLDGVPPFSYRWSGSNGVRGDTSGVFAVPFAVSNLAQGTYRITVTDSSNERCAFIMPPAYVNGPGARVRGLNITPVRCAGAATGGICVEFFGNTPAAFRWSTGDTAACLTGLRGGLYSVTISENGCLTTIDSIIVPEAPALSLIGEATPASCSNSRDGAIALSVFGGNGGYRYRWSTGMLTPNIQGLLPGSYAVTVTDLDGCSITESVQVPAPPPLEVGLDSLLGISCKGSQDGYIQVSGRGGTAPYQYNWQGGSVAAARAGLAVGTYRVTVSDFKGCRSEASFSIQEPASLTGSISIEALPRCVGDTSGILRAVAMGGYAPYSYVWSNGSDQVQIQNTGVGAYSVVIRDNRGCQADTARVEVQTISRLNWRASVTHPQCEGRADGRISLAPEGRPPFRFRWEHGDTTAMATGLSQGRYAVRVEDAEGCLYDTSFVLLSREAPIRIDVSAIPPSCAGGADGLINLSPLQVQYPPLFYSWKDGFSEKDRKGLQEGNYPVTITDGAGCRLALDTVLLKSPPPLRYELAGRGEIVCKGDSTGFLELNVSGGVAPYSFSWIGVEASGASVYGLKAGTYQVFILDSKGCPLNAVFTLTEPPALNLAVDVTIGNICLGDTTNQLRAQISGGVGPYSLRWSNGKTEPVLNNVLPGDYALAALDAKGCRQTVPSIKVRDGGKPLELISFRSRNISCFGERDGELSISVKGGKPPYTYVFRGTATSVVTNLTQWTLTGLRPGSNYGVVVADVQGCVVETAEAAIREPFLLNLRRDSIRTVTCAGGNTGAIFVTANGGTPPYAFNWFDAATGREVATTEDLISFRSGTYRLVVTDSRLCTDTLIATIPTRSSIALTDAVVLQVRCKGDSTGLIEVKLSGGRPPYRMFWNGRPGGPVLSRIPAGTYELSVVDSDSCRTVFPPFILTEPLEGIRDSVQITPVSCDNRGDGALEVRLAGAQGAFQSIWRNAQNIVLGLDTLRLNGLSEGVYRLFVLDERGCSKDFSYTVPRTPSIQVRFNVIPPGSMQEDGLVEAALSGGTPPYRLRWNTGDTTATLNGVGAGVYALTVTDSRNCSLTDSVTLRPTDLKEAGGHAAQGRIYPNPARNLLYLELAFIAYPETPEWMISDLTGRRWQRGALPAGEKIRQEIRLEALPPGSYLITVYSKGLPVWVKAFVKM